MSMFFVKIAPKIKRQLQKPLYARKRLNYMHCKLNADLLMSVYFVQTVSEIKYIYSTINSFIILQFFTFAIW